MDEEYDAIVLGTGLKVSLPFTLLTQSKYESLPAINGAHLFIDRTAIRSSSG